MADISKITVGGVTYNIKDVKARESIAALSSYTSYLGVTTTDLVDGVTTSPAVVINEKTVTAQKGNIVTKGKKEFIYNGTAWQEFGDLSALGALAFKGSASGSYTPVGKVESTFTGTPTTISVSGTATGTISKPTFTGTAKDFSITGTPTGSVDIKTKEPTTGETANYTPAGTVSKPIFSGILSKFSASGDGVAVTVESQSVDASHAVNYTPAGTVSAPTITTTKATVTTDFEAGSAAAFTVTDEILTITAGTAPSAKTTTVLTGASASAPTFTGTGTHLSGTTADLSVTGKFTPMGTVSQPSFTGIGTLITGTFTGTPMTATGSYTPEGSISQPTFTGTKITSTGSYTPEGTVSSTFTGTAATITVK